jgi:hypothetical protein
MGYEVSWKRTDGKAQRMAMERLEIPEPGTEGGYQTTKA